MRHLDEGTIHAWLDGALEAEEAARAEAHVESCSVCAEAVAEARGLIAASSRILLALDNVPNVARAGGSGGAGRAPFRTTWWVRERIAAVVAVIVAGGALAVLMSRGDPRESAVVLTSLPTAQLEVAAADSPAPPMATAAAPRSETDAVAAPISGRGIAAARVQDRDLAATRGVDTTPTMMALEVAEAASPPSVVQPQRTDDTVRSAAVSQALASAGGQAAREEEKAAAADVTAERLRRRGAAENPSRFAAPRTTEPGVGGVVGAGSAAAPFRLMQERRLTEAGQEIVRRIYSVDGILVTLDEVPAMLALEQRRPRVENAVPSAKAPATPAPAPRDSAVTTTNTIRWRDARGAEFTLTGPASPERLARIRLLLGLE